MNIDEIRTDAVNLLDYFKVRFEGKDENFIPIKILLRWIEAFNHKQLDLDEIADIMREGIKYQYDSQYEDIQFFMFCNRMKNVYSELWQEFLTLRFNDKSTD